MALNKEEVRKRLIEVLDPRGTIPKLSEECGISRSTLYTWKSEDRDSLPTIYEGYLISKALNMTLDNLVTGDEPEVQYEKYDDLTEDIIAMVKDLSMEAKLELRGVIRKFIKDYREDLEVKGGTA